MPLEVTGKLHKLYDEQQVTEKFSKREFVLALEGKYAQFVLFQLTGRRCAQLDGFKEGEAVHIEFALRGREWTSRQGEVKYFNSLEVLKLTRTDARAGEPGTGAAHEPDEPVDVPF
jgi:single-strand DNA-binding protein